MENSPDLKRLALALPDIPRLVETRALLLSGKCDLFGLDENDELSFVVSSAEWKLASVIGSPANEAIRAAVAANHYQGVVLATVENSSHVAPALPDWHAGLAHIHRLKDFSLLPSIPQGAVRFLTPAELEAISLPPELKAELLQAFPGSPIAAAFADERPVSFCYAGSWTEGLWDIAIDTLAEYRNRGYARISVAYMVEYMSRQGKQPVWGAEESNVASMRLAAKLGFIVVDQLVIFQPENKN